MTSQPVTHEHEVSRLSPTLQPPAETNEAKIPEDEIIATQLDLGSNTVALTQSGSVKSTDQVETMTVVQTEAELSHADPTYHTEGISYECDV